MSDNTASTYITFHNQASHSFFLLEKDFIASAGKLNRQKEEFRFQQLKSDYVNKLKYRLEECAQELMSRNHLAGSTGQNFNDFIKDYLFRFVQKINSY